MEKDFEFWKTNYFADESKYNLFGSDGKLWRVCCVTCWDRSSVSLVFYTGDARASDTGTLVSVAYQVAASPHPRHVHALRQLKVVVVYSVERDHIQLNRVISHKVKSVGMEHPANAASPFSSWLVPLATESDTIFLDSLPPPYPLVFVLPDCSVVVLVSGDGWYSRIQGADRSDLRRREPSIRPAGGTLRVLPEFQPRLCPVFDPRIVVENGRHFSQDKTLYLVSTGDIVLEVARIREPPPPLSRREVRVLLCVGSLSGCFLGGSIVGRETAETRTDVAPPGTAACRVATQTSSQPPPGERNARSTSGESAAARLEGNSGRGGTWSSARDLAVAERLGATVRRCRRRVQMAIWEASVERHRGETKAGEQQHSDKIIDDCFLASRVRFRRSYKDISGSGTTHLLPRRTGFDSRQGRSRLGHVGIVTDHTAGRLVFWGISRFPCPFIPARLHTDLPSPSSPLKTSILNLFTHSLRSCWDIVFKPFRNTSSSAASAGIEPAMYIRDCEARMLIVWPKVPASRREPPRMRCFIEGHARIVVICTMNETTLISLVLLVAKLWCRNGSQRRLRLILHVSD
ncbi:hypothetical protein PR048_017545 [Dryococelus australis]|uniref:Uncharacterized protein n=1 Tax=Dryococelus australis TaxID=614101 RepID=A0ABQ9H9U0_9NEOP|nr:hypothetical protein PR048_017545 [Dryococelus australis]